MLSHSHSLFFNLPSPSLSVSRWNASAKAKRRWSGRRGSCSIIRTRWDWRSVSFSTRRRSGPSSIQRWIRTRSRCTSSFRRVDLFLCSACRVVAWWRDTWWIWWSAWWARRSWTRGCGSSWWRQRRCVVCVCGGGGENRKAERVRERSVFFLHFSFPFSPFRSSCPFSQAAEAAVSSSLQLRSCARWRSWLQDR